MAGKRCVFATGSLFGVMDNLTKNQLIDLVADLARAELGEGTTNDVVVDWLKPKLETIWRVRGDKGFNVAQVYNKCCAAYARTGQ